MGKVSTTAIEKEELLDSVITSRYQMPIRWDMGVVQSMNGDQPHTEIDEQIDERSATKDDPYPYGWRYIQNITEDGEEEWDRVALTSYDLLHPQIGDRIMERTPHGRNIEYVRSVVGTQLTGDPHAFVFSDLRTDLNLPGIEPVGSDISVVFDVAEKKDWGTFYCQEEGTFPSVVFEMTSPKTRKNDFGKKYEYYRQAGIPFYLILDIKYDKNKQVSEYKLLVHKLVGKSYVLVEADAQGRYWLPSLSIWIGLGDDGILCYDAQENLLLDHKELFQALANEQQNHSETAQALVDTERHLADAEKHLAQEIDRSVAQERVARKEAERAAELERIAEQEACRAQQEVERSAELERVAQEEANRAKQEFERASELERIAEQEANRADEQEQIAKQESDRAAELERIAEQEAIRSQQESKRAEQATLAQEAAEAENARLRALIAQLGGEL